MVRLAVAAAGIALLPFGFAAAQGARDDASFIWSKQLASGSTLTIRNGNGPVDVREASNDRVEVRAVKVAQNRRSNINDVTFDVREVGGDAQVCTVYDGSSICDRNSRSNRNIDVRVDYTVSIPR
jgi:hypothetical protein